MDLTDSHYFRISRFLLRSLGLWAYQTSWIVTLRKCIVLVPIFFNIPPQIIRVTTSFKEGCEIFTEAMAPFITISVNATKFSTLHFSKKKLKMIQDKMNDDWRNLRDKEEIEIMTKYLKTGEIYAAAYAYYMYFAGFIFIFQVFQSPLLNYFIPLNESRPLKPIYPADYYFFNLQDYFWYINLSMGYTVFIVVTVLSATESLFLMYIQYICGMLAVIGHRMEYAMYRMNITDMNSDFKEKEKYKRYIKNCIRTQRNAYELIELIKSTFEISFLIQLGLNICGMSITLVQLVIFLGDFEIIRCITYILAQLFHLFCTCYQGQEIFNHSNDISNKIYNGMWYNTPVETQKMLLFMLYKVSIPSYLTAGKVFIFSMENFSNVVQKCMSFFMALVSFR